MASIDVYTICWNEERMLPFFLRHYASFATRIVVFDNHSTDATRQIAAEHPLVELRTFGASRDGCGELERMAIRETAWLESRGRSDWVIVVDCDEYLWHPWLLRYLETCHTRGVTVPRPAGYEMVSATFPAGNGQIYDEVRLGLRASHMDKWLIFDPNAVEAMNYSPGCHHALPTGRIAVDKTPQLKLLHFKHLGSDYVAARYETLNGRRAESDRSMGLNYHYEWPPQALRDWLASAIGQAVDVFHPSLNSPARS